MSNATAETLQRRRSYGGRKGRSAARRLRAMSPYVIMEQMLAKQTERFVIGERVDVPVEMWPGYLETWPFRVVSKEPFGYLLLESVPKDTLTGQRVLFFAPVMLPASRCARTEVRA